MSGGSMGPPAPPSSLQPSVRAPSTEEDRNKNDTSIEDTRPKLYHTKEDHPLSHGIYLGANHDVTNVSQPTKSSYFISQGPFTRPASAEIGIKGFRYAPNVLTKADLTKKDHAATMHEKQSKVEIPQEPKFLVPRDSHKDNPMEESPHCQAHPDTGIAMHGMSASNEHDDDDVLPKSPVEMSHILAVSKEACMERLKERHRKKKPAAQQDTSGIYHPFGKLVPKFDDPSLGSQTQNNYTAGSTVNSANQNSGMTITPVEAYSQSMKLQESSKHDGERLLTVRQRPIADIEQNVPEKLSMSSHRAWTEEPMAAHVTPFETSKGDYRHVANHQHIERQNVRSSSSRIQGPIEIPGLPFHPRSIVGQNQESPMSSSADVLRLLQDKMSQEQERSKLAESEVWKLQGDCHNAKVRIQVLNNENQALKDEKTSLSLLVEKFKTTVGRLKTSFSGLTINMESLRAEKTLITNESKSINQEFQTLLQDQFSIEGEIQRLAEKSGSFNHELMHIKEQAIRQLTEAVLSKNYFEEKLSENVGLLSEERDRRAKSDHLLNATIENHNHIQKQAEQSRQTIIDEILHTKAMITALVETETAGSKHEDASALLREVQNINAAVSASVSKLEQANVELAENISNHFKRMEETQESVPKLSKLQVTHILKGEIRELQSNLMSNELLQLELKDSRRAYGMLEGKFHAKAAAVEAADKDKAQWMAFEESLRSQISDLRVQLGTVEFQYAALFRDYELLRAQVASTENTMGGSTTPTSAFETGAGTQYRWQQDTGSGQALQDVVDQPCPVRDANSKRKHVEGPGPRNGKKIRFEHDGNTSEGPELSENAAKGSASTEIVTKVNKAAEGSKAKGRVAKKRTKK